VTPETGVTVIVPTLNRGGFLADCLADLLAQCHRPLEILVVDQSDRLDAAVREVAEEHPDVISHQRVNLRGLPRARNYGWQRARYQAIVFVDDDTRCGPELVSEHLRALRLPGVGIVAGGIDTLHGRPDYRGRPAVYRRWTATPLRGFASRVEAEADHAAGCNFSTWRHVLAAVGGFDEALSVGAALYEELDFCLRAKSAGYRVYFNGSARLIHLVAPGGGCRVDRVRDHVWALAHNRGMMIRRHGRWYHAPVAAIRLTALGLSHARYYREPGALLACASGGVRGFRDGARVPACTASGLMEGS
jgi:GT2 family glycosyltransferase